MPFQKGQSGNPNGRPKKGHSLTEALERALQKRAKGKSAKELLAGELLILALDAPQAADRITAIKYIYDRIDGRMPNVTQLGGVPDGDGEPIKIVINRPKP